MLRRALPIALYAAALVVAYFVAFGRVELNLADEGYLWYGVLRTLEGRLPLRDFQSYEPGRYWWCALWSPLVGSGIFGIRASIAVFQVFGLACGLALVRRLTSGPWLTALAGPVLLLWMFPRHKVFDSSLALMLVWAGVLLLERPTLRCHLAMGVAVGLAGVMGRNHILYASLGCGLLILVSALRLHGGRPLMKLATWSGGVILGFSPLLVLLAFAPGFAPAFLESVLFFTGERGTNLPLPYPWPWHLGFEHLATFERVALAAAFLIPPIVYPLGLVATLRARAGDEPGRPVPPARAVLAAASLIGVFYAHHASVRSDPSHLAQSIHPALLALLALPFAFPSVAPRSRAAWGTIVAVGLVAVTLIAVPATDPTVVELRAAGDRTRLVEFEAAGDELRLPARSAAYLERLTQAIERNVPADEPLFVAPGLATLYPLLGRRSPVWGIYFLWPAGEDAQRELRDQLADVDWALIVDTAIDDRPELLFRKTHRLVWEDYVLHAERVPTPELPRNHYLFRRVK